MKEKRQGYRISDARMESFGIATLLVILVHAKPYNWEAFPSALYKICEQGSIGVDIFLFLSGMGLFYAMKKCDSVKAFYKRRILRIIPSYFLIGGILYAVLVWRTSLTLSDYFLHMSTLYLWVEGISVTWYVSFILVLYLVYPLLYRVLEGQETRVSAKAMLLLTLLLAFLGCIFIFLSESYLTYEQVWARIPIFVLGAIWGRMEYDGKSYPVWSVWGCGVVFVLIRDLLLVFGDSTSDLYQVGVRVSYIFGTLFIVGIMPILVRTIFANPIGRLLGMIGEVSLEVYLFHSLWNQIFMTTQLYKTYNTPVSYVVWVVVPSIIIVMVGDRVKRAFKGQCLSW